MIDKNVNLCNLILAHFRAAGDFPQELAASLGNFSEYHVAFFFL